MQHNDLYRDAHLVVAAIRISDYRKSAPPSIEDIGRMLSFSMERCNLLCKKLKDFGVIDLVEGAYGIRLSIKDHLLIEEMPREDEPSAIEKEIQKFSEERKQFSEKIESFQTEQEKKKKSLFAELEKKLKKDLRKE